LNTILDPEHIRIPFTKTRAFECRIKEGIGQYDNADTIKEVKSEYSIRRKGLFRRITQIFWNVITHNAIVSYM
jgi:hypothetical protein